MIAPRAPGLAVDSPAFIIDAPVRFEREFAWGTGDVSYRVGRAGQTIVAEWIGVGMLLAAPDGSRHEFRAQVGADEREVARIGRTVVASLVRHLRGEVALHASGVVLKGRAIAFMGASGSGKSTFAAELCKSQHGALAADDVAFIDTSNVVVHLEPTEQSHRLLVPGTATPKRLFAAPRVAKGPAPLSALVALATSDAGSAPELVALTGAAAFAAVNEAFVRFVTDDAARNVRDFETVAYIVSRVPVLELRRPRDLGELPRVTELVLRFLASGGTQ